jgi:antitoxin component of RelBE/YafQ-DinJ toxin-antitoxin module
MNLTLSIDDRLLERTRKRASEMGTTVNQMVRDYFKTVVGEEDLEATLAFLKQTAGQGKPDPDWKWNREETYEERFSHYGKS